MRELRPSPVELFGAFGGASLAGLLLVAVLFGGLLAATPVQRAAAFVLSTIPGLIACIFYGQLHVTRGSYDATRTALAAKAAASS